MPESTSPVRVAAVCGSLRSGSYNRSLMNEAMRRQPDGLVIGEVPIRDFPLFDADVELTAYPPQCAEAKASVAASDCLLLVTPEYDFGVPGVLKNAIDWMSRPSGDQSLQHKPLALMGASTGYFGTARAQLHWRESWHYFKGPVFSEVELHVSFAPKAFDADGRLTNDLFIGVLDDYLAKLLAWLRAMKRL